MKKHLLLSLFSALLIVFGNPFSSVGQVTIGLQDFEASPAAPVMTYTGGSIATGTGPFPAGHDNFVSGSRGLEESNGTSTVVFATVDASAHTDVFVTFRLASFSGTSGNGADGGDEVYLDVSDDGGSTWSREVEVEGNSNARWSFTSGTGVVTETYDGNNAPSTTAPGGGSDRTTDGYSTVTLNGLPAVSGLRIRIVMENNSGNEYWIIDDVAIRGTAASSNTITTGTSLTGSPFCIGAAIGGAAVSVPYTTSGTFNGGNVFTAQLSDASGSFASPTSIGTGASPISATIASSTTSGTGYRIRVVGSDPVTNGSDNGTDLIINSFAAPTSFAVSCGNTTADVSWTNPDCFDDVMVVAKATAFTGATPTGTGYTADASFTGAGTAFDGGKVVFKATSGTSETVTDLTNGTTYFFKIFSRKGSTWVAGAVESCAPATGPCGSESFDNVNAPSGGYDDGDFPGDNSLTWSYIQCRADEGYEITGDGIMLRRLSSSSAVSTGAVSGGMGDFSCKLFKAYSSTSDRQVTLYVNGTLRGTSVAGEYASVETFTVTGINEANVTSVEIRNNTGNQVIVDDIEWSCYAPTIPPVNLSVSASAGTEAAATVITVTATADFAVSGAQTVDIAVTGTGITAGDYTLSNTTITIANGATTGSVTFTVVNDVLTEGTETATLTISNPSGGVTIGSTATQDIAITDNDQAANDNCAAPVNLTVNAAATNGNMLGVTATNGGALNKADLWYTFTTGCAGSYTITTACTGMDIELEIYPATPCPSDLSTRLASATATNNTSETLNYTAAASTTYLVRVLDWNGVGNAFTIAVTTSVAPQFTLANTGTPATGNIAVNTTNEVVFGFALTANACTGTYNFTACNIATAGTATTADLSNFRILVDADNDGVADAGEIASPIGTVAALANPLAFTGLGQTSLTGTTRYLLVADVAVGATGGRTITASLTSANVTSPVTVTGSATGNTQTITAACAAPTADAGLALTPTSTSVAGVITAPTGGATGYVVVRHTTTTLGGAPTTAATYTVGNSIGSGTVVYSGTGTTFTDAGPLSPSTAYFYFVFAYNNTSCGGGPMYAAEVEETVTTLSGPCLSENFDASTGLPTDWSDTGSANDAVASHRNSAPNCRALGSGDNLVTSSVDYPSTISFYVDASGSGGQAGTLEYQIGTGGWNSVGTFTADDNGGFETFPLNSSPNLTAAADVTFRISSGGFTIYIDDVEVFCASAQPSIQLSLEAPVSGTGTETAATTVTLRATASETLTAAHSVEVDISGTGITSTDFDNGADFSGTVSINIANGASFGELTFKVADDADVEGPETATFTISNPSSGVVIGTANSVDLAITDNDNVTSTASVIIEQSGEATGISSVVNGIITDNTEGTRVWAFNLYDGDGTNNDADSKPTIYEQWIIRADGVNNTVPDWDVTIDNVKFFLGASATPIPGSFLVNPTSISFLPSTPITVADGTTPAIITMRITLDATLPLGSDGQHFAFSLDDSDVTVETDVLLSSQLGTFTEASDAVLNGIDITATLQFIDAPTAVSVGSSFSVTVSAVDANGNVDTGISNSITLSLTSGSGTLSGAPSTVNLTSGTHTFTGLNHDTEEVIEITVHDNAIVNPFADLTTNINVTDEPHQLFDDFNRADNNTVGIPSSGGSTSWTEDGLFSNEAHRIAIDGNELYLGGCVAGSSSGSTGSTGMEQVRFNGATLYETAFDNAGSQLEWLFNMKQTRTNPSGFGGSTYAAAIVLGCDENGFENVNADGYAVVIGNGGTPDPVKLVRFTGGLSTDVNVTNVAVSGQNNADNYYSVKVTYDPCTGLWSLYVRNDGTSAFAEPNVGSLGTAVTGTDQTHTALDLRYFGAGWQHSSSCGEYLRVDNLNIPNATSATTTAKVWNGSVDANWNVANNWGPCPGVPTITDNVEIANVAIQPIISAATPVAVCNNLTVDAGATLTINGARELTADGNVTNNGTVTVEVGGNFIQTPNGTAAHTGSGNFAVKRQAVGGYNGWSTPVVGGVLPGSAGYWYDSSEGTSDPTDDNAPDPDPGWFPFSGAMQPSRGYYSNNGGSPTFVGKANNGTYNTVGITPEGAPGTRYNLVGNPYPSSIDADEFIDNNSGIIDGSLYFWDDDNSGSGGYTPNDYATYTLNGAVPTLGGTNAGGPTPTGNIASCQGFFVSCTNAGNINFNNGQRSGSNNQFFRMAAPDAQRLWLSISNTNLELFNQTLVAFDEFATDQKDWGVDAIKFRGNQDISIGAIQDAETYVIATYESIPQSGKIVPLMTFVDNAATYTFAADSMEGFDNHHVFLEDLSTGSLYPIEQGDSYSFAMTSADEYNRFQLWFSPVLITGVNEAENNFNIYATQDNMIVVETASRENFNGTVEITDMAGRRVLTNDISIANGIGRVQGANFANGVYAITFVSYNGNIRTSQKVALGQ